ncbi:hypothetical protein [Streptomyces sp. NBC_00525]|uniref:hypothetical protein n=1 Tax=Streptomyces sp. NBC_00525 TaxID=2903660 RepID=UPI002E80355A|nr:hypothetical protein [Streptomyces sp. NBC_00525]WUC97512.1 hypothetical protein OG710_29560 [Streptomyces sp. NBC_00525]
MSLTSPIPVLRGSGGAVLQSEGDDLVLSRADVETRIPLQAVRRIRAEGSAVAVELTAPAGTAPAVHRVDGLSRAAVTVFADAVNAALPERAEEAGETADGSALVTVRALTEPPESEQDRRTRVFRLWLKTVALVTVVLAVAVGITSQAVLGLSVLVLLPIGLTLTTGGYMGLKIVWKQWYLPRKGITVVAVRREGATDEFGGTGNFVYMDLHGQSRAMYAQSRAEDIPVAYHPERPGTVAACQSWLRNSVETVFNVALLLLGLAIDALIVGLAVGAFLGLYDDYVYTLG